MQNRRATLEDSFTLSYKIKVILPYTPVSMPLGVYLKELKMYIHAKTCTQMCTKNPVSLTKNPLCVHLFLPFNTSKDYWSFYCMYESFPECYMVRIIHYVAASVWLFSSPDLHLSFFMSLRGFNALSAILWCGYARIYLYIYLMRDNLADSTFCQLWVWTFVQVFVWI